MAPRQRYERVAAEESSNTITGSNPSAMIRQPSYTIPSSPPPSFRSRTSSRRPSRDGIRQTPEQRNLHDAFDAPSDDDSDDAADEPDAAADRRRLIQGGPDDTAASNTSDNNNNTRQARPAPQRTVTEIPVFTPSLPANSGSVIIGGRAFNTNAAANDGVWANLNAKPRPGEEVEEKPPTYEQAAADATPPYWETTVLSPYGASGNPDDVFIDGLLVGSVFSFVWNALISMSFQLIGFLLTYLLHTTHAAKNGSRAGLGITLIQYGFQMRYAAAQSPLDGPNGGGGMGSNTGVPADGIPDNPNKHDFDPGNVGSGSGDDGSGAAGFLGAMTTTDWMSYVLMIIGWFILIRAVSDLMRARRQEALVRSSPDRGLPVPVVAEGEAPESTV